MNLARQRSGKNKKRLWPVKVFFLTFLLAMLISLFSETSLLGVSLIVALIELLCIVLIGVLFDIVGVAVTFEEVSAYNAMASKKIRGAKEAIRLVQSASMVSNICNDVVGDICGIVSGAAGAAITAKIIMATPGLSGLIIGIAVSSLIAAVTVGGKAAGKAIAIKHSHEIVFLVGKLLAIFTKNTQDRKKERK